MQHLDRYRGDPKDGWDVGYNHVFSPYSNPNSHRWNNTTATNIAIEITGKHTGGSGEDIFDLYIYITNPDSASPAKLQNVAASYNSSNQVVVTWTASSEPDMPPNGGGYNVYREVYYGTTVVTSTKLNSSLLTSTSYTDANNYSVSGVPNDVDLYARYRIEYVDNTGKASIKSDGAKIFLGKTVFGEISASQTWNGSYAVIDNTTLLSGRSLTIQTNSVIRCASSATFTSYGYLTVGNITFIPFNGATSGSWGPIILNGYWAGPSNLNGVTIRYGDGIQFINGANATLQYSTIENNNHGIYFYSSAPLILNNTIRYNS